MMGESIRQIWVNRVLLLLTSKFNIEHTATENQNCLYPLATSSYFRYKVNADANHKKYHNIIHLKEGIIVFLLSWDVSAKCNKPSTVNGLIVI